MNMYNAYKEMELVTEKLPTKTVGNFLLKHCFILKRDDIDFGQKSISLFNLAKMFVGLAITMQDGTSDVDNLLKRNVEVLNDEVLKMVKARTVNYNTVDAMIANIETMFLLK